MDAGSGTCSITNIRSSQQFGRGLTGGVYYWLGRLDEAVVAWEKALEIYVRSETLSDPERT